MSETLLWLAWIITQTLYVVQRNAFYLSDYLCPYFLDASKPDRVCQCRPGVIHGPETGDSIRYERDDSLFYTFVCMSVFTSLYLVKKVAMFLIPQSHSAPWMPWRLRDCLKRGRGGVTAFTDQYYSRRIAVVLPSRNFPIHRGVTEASPTN